MNLEALINAKNGQARPLLCLEVNPPRGTDFGEILDRLEGKLNGVDFLNVTDSALARMKMSPFVFASELTRRFSLECLVNVSCRDRNLIAIQSELLGAWALGVKSIVALTGDAVSVGDDPQRKGVFETNSVGLLSVIKCLNEGSDLVGNKLKGFPSYLPGVVVNPNAKNPSAEIKRLQKKRDAGAVYALSQPVFDVENALRFFEEAAKVDVALFLGLLPLKSARAASHVASIPGIRLSPELEGMLSGDLERDISEYSMEHGLKIAKACRSYVAGYHVISGATPKLAINFTARLAEHLRLGSI